MDEITSQLYYVWMNGEVKDLDIYSTLKSQGFIVDNYGTWLSLKGMVYLLAELQKLVVGRPLNVIADLQKAINQ